jgi:hypothetical protein
MRFLLLRERKREREKEHLPLPLTSRKTQFDSSCMRELQKRRGTGFRTEPHRDSAVAAFRMRRHELVHPFNGICVRHYGGYEYARSHRDYCIISIDKRESRRLAPGGRGRGAGWSRNYLTADTRRGRAPRNKKFRKVFDRIADENEVNAVAFGNARSG